MKESLSLVIPLYNEQKNISLVINPLIEALNSSQINYELILVNNGSLDSTPQLLNGLAKEHSNIKIVNIIKNQGYGWAIMSGLQQAEGSLIGYMCGDGQVKPEDSIKVFKEVVSKKVGLVKVSRVLRRDGIKRKIISKLYNALMQIMFDIKIQDVNGTPKIFRKELLDTFKLKSRDWFIDAEIIIKSKILKLKILDVPIEFLARKNGKSNVHILAIFEFLKNICIYKFGSGINL